MPVSSLAPGARASLAIAGDGTLHVATLRGSPLGSYGSGDQEILLTTSRDGGRSFARPQPISRYGERVPFYFGTPRVEVDSARRWIYVAYTRGGRDGKWDLALAATKDALNREAGLDLETALAHEAEVQARLMQGPDFREGHAAFLEKRLPKFP